MTNMRFTVSADFYAGRHSIEEACAIVRLIAERRFTVAYEYGDESEASDHGKRDTRRASETSA